MTKTAVDIKQQLELLHHERRLASAGALAEQVAYMADLDQEIEATTQAFVGSAVDEIARLRGQLDGPSLG
jgi:hypothetical protein